MMHEGDERSAHLAARAGGDLGRDLPLRFGHCFGSQPWKSRLHSPYYPPCMVADLLLGVHFAIAAFIVGGLLLVWAGAARGWGWVRNPWFRYLHLRSEEHTSELQSQSNLVCRLLLEKKNIKNEPHGIIPPTPHRVAHRCLLPPHPTA